MTLSIRNFRFKVLLKSGEAPYFTRSLCKFAAWQKRENFM